NQCQQEHRIRQTQRDIRRAHPCFHMFVSFPLYGALAYINRRTTIVHFRVTQADWFGEWRSAQYPARRHRLTVVARASKPPSDQSRERLPYARCRRPILSEVNTLWST